MDLNISVLCGNYFESIKKIFFKKRDLFKKIRDTKGSFHAKRGKIKDRTGIKLTEAEDIKKRWQENTAELYQKRSY